MRQETPVATVARVLRTKPTTLYARLAYYKVKVRGLSPPQLAAALSEKTGQQLTKSQIAKLEGTMRPKSNGHANGNGLAHQEEDDKAAVRDRRAILIALQRMERLARERIGANQYGELEVAALDAWLVAQKAARINRSLEIA